MSALTERRCLRCGLKDNTWPDKTRKLFSPALHCIRVLVVKKVTNMKLKDQLEGFKLNWLADEVTNPMGTKGMNVNTFYSFVYNEKKVPPQWLINELSRITGREIKL